MSTIPARLAQVTRRSPNHPVARQRAISLYRDWHRAAPTLCEIYAISSSPADVRRAIRAEFERNRYVTDLKVIDILLLKGHQAYQEAMNNWMQDSHVLGMLLSPKGRPQRTFMQKFLEGRDEDQVLPAPNALLQKETII